MGAQHRLLAATMCGVATLIAGSAEDRLIDLQRSAVTVRMFPAGASGTSADEHVILVPLAEGSLGDAATPHVQIVIDARRLRVVDAGRSAKDRDEMQARMLGPALLDVDRFPRITFHSLSNQPVGPGAWLVHGELELHGHFRPVTVSVFSESTRYKGSTTVRQSDYGMAPISLLGNAASVKDEVRVDFDIVVADDGRARPGAASSSPRWLRARPGVSGRPHRAAAQLRLF